MDNRVGEISALQKQIGNDQRTKGFLVYRRSAHMAESPKKEIGGHGYGQPPRCYTGNIGRYSQEPLRSIQTTGALSTFSTTPTHRSFTDHIYLLDSSLARKANYEQTVNVITSSSSVFEECLVGLIVVLNRERHLFSYFFRCFKYPSEHATSSPNEHCEKIPPS